MLLLLARVCSFMESNALVHVMETLAATFPGQGGGSGSGQPPAFVAGEVARLGSVHFLKRLSKGMQVMTHWSAVSAPWVFAAAKPLTSRMFAASAGTCLSS